MKNLATNKNTEKKVNKGMLKEVTIITAIISLIALVAGALLGAVYYFCKVDDIEILNKKIAVCYQAESFTDNLKGDLVSQNAVFKNGSVDGVYRPKNEKTAQIFMVTGFGAYNGTLKLLIAIENDKIINIIKFLASETPGLGSNAFTEKFLNQFIGVDVNTYDVFLSTKAGGSITTLTGATKSSVAVMNAVNCAIVFYKEFKTTIASADIGGGVA